MRRWTRRQWAVAAGGAVLLLLVLGIPAVLIPNGLFTREIEPTWWSYPVWAATAVLGGVLMATYAGPGGAGACAVPRRQGLGGGLLAWFAIACPVCNTLVLAAVGTAGALNWFAPAQPVLALLGLGLLAFAVRTRLRTAPEPPAVQLRGASD